MQKIVIAESDIRQALEGIECPRPIKTALHNDARYGYLDIHVQTLIDTKQADDIISAIRFLVSYKMNNGTDVAKVNLGHIQGNPSNNVLYNKLKTLAGKLSQKNTGDQTKVFGIKSHVFIPELFSHGFVKHIKKDSVRMIQSTLEFGSTVRELPLIEAPVSKEPKSMQKISIRIKKIQSAWKKLLVAKDTDLFPLYNPQYQKLISLMSPLFNYGTNDGIKQILELGERTKESEYLAFLTVLTWATIVLRHAETGPLILFKEISLMPYHYDVGLGRIDALTVAKINGTAPTQEQSILLERMSHEKFKSVGHLVLRLVQLFGDNISLLVYDWKFAVGDGVNGIHKTLNIIHRGEIISKPILKHERQMERYISTIFISYAMVASNNDIDLQSVWKSKIEICGEIHYFFPESMPVVHQVGLSEEEKREVFRAQVVNPYTNGEYRSKVTNVSKTWLNLSIGLIQKGFAVTKPGQIQLTLGNFDDTMKGKVSKVIKNSIEIKWYDELQTVEQVGEWDDGSPKLFLHLDKCIDAIDRGLIQVSNGYDHATGGLVHCWLPEHKHTGRGTPSFGIYQKYGGGGKCFGSCGVSMKFAEGSIPESLENRIQPVTKKLLIRTFSDIEAFHVSDRYSEAMNAAQRIFQNQFLFSQGAHYLEVERKLNPELSMMIGAGFADSRSIEYLLDMGFTYDELIEFGFVGISHNVKEHGPTSKMVEILRHRGFSLNDIQRLKPKSVVKGQPPVLLPALPYIVLDNRLTYPLDVNHVITHFYGRSVDVNCPKDYAHQKTSPRTGVPQGGFNITNAMEKAIRKNRDKKLPGSIPQIGMTEAIIDVDTMVQHGDLKEFGAFVGVNNHLLFQILAQFPGSITTALNWDESRIIDGRETLMAGQRNTVKFIKYMQSVNFGYPLYDFTEPFAKKHHDFNDLNAYWKKIWKEYWEGGKTAEAQKRYLNPFNVTFNRKRLLLSTTI